LYEALLEGLILGALLIYLHGGPRGWKIRGTTLSLFHIFVNI